MAECVMASLDTGHRFLVDSAATSSEEIGNPIYPPARRVLGLHGIPLTGHHARRIRREEYGLWDIIVGMDGENIQDLRRLFDGDREGKVVSLLDEEIDDPWYTGDFETAYRMIRKGCERLLLDGRKSWQ
jgi:protein-tyrosine phosphatase